MIVVDSSVVLALLTADRRQPFVRTLLAPRLGTLRAPLLLSFEVIHVLSRKQRQGELELSEQSRAIRDFEAQSIDFDQRPDPDVLGRIATLADGQKLSGYDAAYLELSIRLGADLATLDGPLADAGRRCGLTVHHAP